MNSILPAPIFDNNTFLHELVPSHKATESQYIIDTVNPNKLLGIVSSGHDGIELAKLDCDTHIYLPIGTPEEILKKSKEVSNKVIRVGKNYPDCYKIAEGIIKNRNDMLNVSAGIIETYHGFKRILEAPLRDFRPDYIFVPDSNLDLCIGILEGLKENKIDGITVVACVLPDHFNISSRFNAKYNHEPFFTGITFMKHDAPGLNRNFKLYDNLFIKTVKSPDYCFAKYNHHYPDLDAMNYLSMEIAFKFNKDSKKLVVITGENLL